MYNYKDRHKRMENFGIDVGIIDDAVRLFRYMKGNPRTQEKWNKVETLF